MKLKPLLVIVALGIFVVALALVLRSQFVAQQDESQLGPQTTLEEASDAQESTDIATDVSETVRDEPVAGNDASDTVLTTVNCDHSISCFINAVANSKNAHYSGEVRIQYLPGVAVTTSQIWDFRVVAGSASSTFTYTTSDAKIALADDWFAVYFASNEFPAELRQQIDDATYLTEEELEAIGPEVRAVYEQQIADGKTPQQMAKELAAYQLENSIWSSMAVPYDTVKTCSLDDRQELIAVLNKWEQEISSSTDLDFANCQTSLR